MRNFTLTLSLLLFATLIYAQKARKFGTVSKEEVAMTEYAPDPTAKAVILYDYGESSVGYNSSEFIVTLKIHHIVKLFEDDEFHRGDIVIRYPQGSAVQKLKAVTYNLENGKIVESELSKADIFEEKLTDGVREKKFSMPDLAPGSVIEYTYTIRTGNLFYLNSWYFQSTIPVKWSEYRIKYPKWFNYKTLSQGYLQFHINERKVVNFNFSGQTISGTSQRFVVKNAPAFKVEKYITTRDNYLSKMDFELRSIEIDPTVNSQGYFKEFFSSFEKVRTQLLSDANFGKRLDDGKFLSSDIQKIKAEYTKTIDIIAGIYNLIRDQVNWNNVFTKYGYTSVKKVYAGEEASSAEINLLLVSALRKAGFVADPVILSTRSHGVIHPVYPLMKRYNHVICQVKEGANTYLLDATSKLIPFGMLPEYDLNGQGQLISERGTDWVKLKPTQPQETDVSANMQITADGLLEGKINTEYKGYAAVNIRHKIDTDGLDKYKNSLSSADGWEIEAINLENIEDIGSPVKQELTVMLEGNAEGLGDIIYLSPIITNALGENPFKLEKRLYPVDYAYPHITRLAFTFNLPEGFKLEDKPGDITFVLPDKGGSYSYSSQYNGNTLTVKSIFKITKPVFLPEEYSALRSFYDKAIAKQAEQFVFKKSTE